MIGVLRRMTAKQISNQQIQCMQGLDVNASLNFDRARLHHIDLTKAWLADGQSVTVLHPLAVHNKIR